MGKRMYDAAAAVELRDVTDGAETSSAAETGVSLNKGSAYWQNDQTPYDFLMAVVNVTACDDGNADETYELYLEVDSELAFGDSPVKVAKLDVTRGFTGLLEIPVSREVIDKLDPNAEFIRIGATLGGTSPSITYGAWLEPLVSHT